MMNNKNIEDINNKSLERIARVIKLCPRKWSLNVVHCNYKSLCEQMMQKLYQICPNLQIQEIVLPKYTETFYEAIKAELQDEQSSALMVFGLESVSDIDKVLKSMEQDREKLSRDFPFPIFLWLTESISSKLVRQSLHFMSWASTPIKFEMPTNDELIDFIKQTTDEVFDKIEKAGAGKLLQKIANNLNLYSSHISDLKSAYNELKSRGINIEPELEASLEFTLGLATEEFPNKSLRHYRRSLKIWQQSNNLVRRGCLLFYLGRWYRTYADINLSLYDKACAKARNYYQKCIENFEKCNRRDLAANFINALGDVLQRLKQWNELEKTAQKALKWSDDKFRLARAYGFLAQVAQSKSDWTNTQKYAQKALNKLKVAIANELKVAIAIEQKQAKPNVDGDRLDWEIGYHKGWYLLPLAQAQRKQNQIEDAIKNLEIAKEDTKPEYDPKLYIQILQELRDIYFNRGQYLEAFEKKKNKLEIEQQFGFRDFIGIGKLQPQKQIVNPAHQSYITTEKIAPEITAFNRKRNVDDLVERIASTQHKLTVIYGPSGSGKSSILRAGLIPELKQKTFATRDCITILQQDYTDWICGIGKSLKEILNLDIDTDSEEAILEQFEKNGKNNLLTVLIFDNLEDFFASNKELQSREEFYAFLQQCLNIPYLKVILSLREDSLHHLLEFNRKENENLDVISKDILNKDILYYLGNVSRADVRSGLKSFSLQSELINQLLEDLAGKSNEVLLIELKVVGTQLENLEIQTLKKYRELGPNPKEILVEKYLEEICQDCGTKNEIIAELLFYLLTDEDKSRPRKSRDELVEGLELAELNSKTKQLDEVLQILVSSDLVYKEKNSYQLVHDYFVIPIRKMCVKKHGNLLVKLNRTRKELRNDLALQELKELNLKSQNLFLEHDQLKALEASVEAGKNLKEITNLPEDVGNHITNTLKQVVYTIDQYNNLNGHEGDVYSLSFSTDGKLLASASWDKTVKLWDVDSGKLLDTLTEYDDYVNSVQFSPDGKFIASASADCTTRIFPIVQDEKPKTFKIGKPISLKEDENFSGDVCLSHDWFWDVCFSPDGQIFASASGDNTIKLWHLDGSCFRTFTGHRGWINSVVFSRPDGKFIASASNDRTVKIWDLKGNCLKTLEGHNGPVYDVGFSPDGKLLASVSADKTIKIWSIDGTLLKTLEGHRDWANSVMFRIDPLDKSVLQLASASNDGTVKLWDLSPIQNQLISLDLDGLLKWGKKWLRNYRQANQIS